MSKTTYVDNYGTVEYQDVTGLVQFIGPFYLGNNGVKEFCLNYLRPARSNAYRDDRFDIPEWFDYTFNNFMTRASSKRPQIWVGCSCQILHPMMKFLLVPLVLLASYFAIPATNQRLLRSTVLPML